MKRSWLFQSTFQIQKFEKSMDLLLVTDGDILHYVYIKGFTRQKIKTKNTFTKVVYSVLVVKMFWKNIEKFVRALMVHNLQDYKKELLSLKIISK